jgi:DNA polymerase/3'-5' exonuclease PolX
VADFPYDRDVDEAAELGRGRSSAKSGKRWPLAEAAKLAAGIAAVLSPACERIEIAGSVRRRMHTVADVEIVAIPRYRVDLFGERVDEPTELDRLVDDLVQAGRFAPRLSSAGTRHMGQRSKRLTAVRSGLPVDLFAVLPPAQFGALLAIRTGPADFSQRLVTVCKSRGLDQRDGRLVARGSGREIATPEERDFVEACGAPYVEPWERR